MPAIMETLWISEEKPPATHFRRTALQYRLISDERTCYYQARQEWEPDKWKEVCRFALWRWQELLDEGFKPKNLYLPRSVLMKLKGERQDTDFIK